MHDLLFDFSLPHKTMIVTRKKSVAAAMMKAAMRKFHDPQCPCSPNHQPVLRLHKSAARVDLSGAHCKCMAYSIF